LFANNAFLAANVRPKVQYTHRDVHQEHTALRVQTSASLASKDSIAARSTQQQFHRLSSRILTKGIFLAEQ